MAVPGQPDHGRDLGEPARGVARQRHAARTARSAGAARRRARTSHRRPSRRGGLRPAGQPSRSREGHGPQSALVSGMPRPRLRALARPTVATLLASARGDPACAAPDRRHRRLHGVHAVPPQHPRARGGSHDAHAREGRRCGPRLRPDRDRRRRGLPLARGRRAGRRRRRSPPSPRPPSPCTAPSTRERRLVELNMCPCDSCTQTSDLKLKFVAHVGEVATQTIKRRRKLVGMDVIFVHRLLKNPVQVPEYVLVSEDLYRSGGTAVRPTTRCTSSRRTSRASGPCAPTSWTSRTSPGPLAPVPDPSWPRRIGGTFGMRRPRPAVHRSAGAVRGARRPRADPPRSPASGAPCVAGSAGSGVAARHAP